MLCLKEIKQVSSLLKKIDNPHNGLPQPIFNALTRVVPFVACELAIINKKKELLLTWRDDEWWKGWHFPGGLLRYKEGFEERIQKVAWEELGVHIKKYKFAFFKNCIESPRGHGVSLVFLCQEEMPPKNGRFFKKMPKNIIKEHKDLWKKLENFLWKKH